MNGNSEMITAPDFGHPRNTLLCLNLKLFCGRDKIPSHAMG